MSDRGHHADSAVVAAIADRVAAQADVLAERFAEAYAADIDDYARVPSEERGEFVRSARANLDALLADLRGAAAEFDSAPFERFGADRMRMGIPMGAVMRSFTVWGRQAWSAFRACLDGGSAAETAASLAIGERIFAHVERASAATAAGFMRQAMLVWSDREVTRNALLEAMLTGRADPDELDRSGSAVADSYDVVVLLPWESSTRVETLVAPTVEIAERLDPGTHPLVGVRESGLVMLWPAGRPGPQVQVLAHRLCSGLGAAAGVGTSRLGLEGVPSAYADALEAARIALQLGYREPIRHEDVLLERFVLGSPLVGEVCNRALGALVAYDERRGADLLATVEAFAGACGSVTEAARAVQVHPNTVDYRLRRVASISGYDPRDPRGLLMLSLATIARRLGVAGTGSSAPSSPLWRV
ncbi:MAG: hypothetical protein GEU74_13555 [Nitriliruptorales bacterium]|nr:hypothetical protein [Nitriliruptorales bacterium]